MPLAASIFHFGEFTVPQLAYLAQQGIEVRPPFAEAPAAAPAGVPA